tara:strand:- start:300 stop:1406 length:1107 start_codon:yes stop_codon:yes gene_type:complete
MTGQVMIGTRKGLFIAEKSRSGWSINKAMLLGDPVTMILVDRHNNWHAAIEHGHFGVKIKRSSDQGRSWKETAVPQFPPKPEDLEDIDPIRQTPIPWSVMRVWSMECAGPEKPDDIWCGTIPGGLFRSSDCGDSWQFVDSLWLHPDRKKWMGGGADYPGIHSILVDPRNDNTIKLGVSCGGVWASFDNGVNWECYGRGLRSDYAPEEYAYDPYMQDPHRMVQCMNDPDAMWIQHHNGIFKSKDGGANWSEIDNAKPSCFGFAVAVDPNDANTAWFVPGVKDDQRYAVKGSVTVSRTQDGGESFEVLRSGLPQEHAYDLVYRHCLDIDKSGTSLVFGSTTGNIWLSENRGDDWVQITSTLPPVYCIRFI